MNSPLHHVKAFGAPGIEPRWTSSAKEGVGTAYHTSCRLWFTLSHGIVNEIYYPRVDQPNTRDFQFLITDGETFCHEEKRDLHHVVEYPERDCLLYRLTNSEPNGRYKLIKHVLTDPHRSVLLIHTKLEVMDESLREKLRLYALLAPYGASNSGQCFEIGDVKAIRAQRENVYLVLACSSGFSRRSVGYVGASDGWQDLMDNFKMDWEFGAAEKGNIALTGEITLAGSDEFTVAIACGGTCQSTATKALQTLAEPFESHRQAYVRQWQRAVVNPKFDFSEDTSDRGGIYRLSRCVLLAHEDKDYQGALVASMSIPWGETKSDGDRGGYHLVWTRDLVQSATALLATGQVSTPLRALIWLATIQKPDGSFPQNSWLDGTAYWSGLQLDEIAAPILLAWRLWKRGHATGLFDPKYMILRAAAYLILQGPVTGQDRWEENAGYSPSTLATVIAGLVCAADGAREKGKSDLSDFILVYADWLAAHLEEWTVTSSGEMVEEKPRHYIRINPTDPGSPDPHADPNSTMIQIANGGGLHPARNVVGGDFLHLVRLGIRSPRDPIVLDSIEVLDRVVKHDLPQGPGWRRYNHDGYGQKDDGSAFDGSGVGRCWPILTGERGHYELAAGRDARPFIKAMEEFSNMGGMITEQLWDADDLPDGRMRRGCPTGAAMPLCWSHAEYVSLVRSHHDGVCFDRVEPAFQRYVAKPVESRHEIWSFRHQLRRISRGKILRIILAAEATIVWTTDGWAHTSRSVSAHERELNLWFADFPSGEWPAGSVFEFTFLWTHDQRWEGRNWQLSVL
ncbi:MAG TPA: glycoside hydrolase family 15 protein [Verrucomicrobiae bacterium]|jgi:glucoamylase|nr:glycoside hydrolase family 15 protein [Verrucomicrobiae bacterium]